MPKAITVTALKPLLYQGREHVRGSVFEATPVDAASLKYRGFVKLGGQLSGGTVPDHPSIARRMEPVDGFQSQVKVSPALSKAMTASARGDERQLADVTASAGKAIDEEMTAPRPDAPMPVNEEPVEQVPAAESTTATVRGRRSGRGTYNRRDMTAEPPTNDTGE